MSETLFHITVAIVSIGIGLAVFARTIERDKTSDETAHKIAETAGGIAFCCGMAAAAILVSQYLHTNVSWW